MDAHPRHTAVVTYTQGELKQPALRPDRPMIRPAILIDHPVLDRLLALLAACEAASLVTSYMVEDFEVGLVRVSVPGLEGSILLEVA